ncbi:hypothetical protein RB597_010248 [Gaeumannomyces tritici]
MLVALLVILLAWFACPSISWRPFVFHHQPASQPAFAVTVHDIKVPCDNDIGSGCASALLPSGALHAGGGGTRFKAGGVCSTWSWKARQHTSGPRTSMAGGPEGEPLDRRQLPSRDRAAAELQKRQDGTGSNTSAAPIGIIVGGVIGSLTVLAILGFAVFFVWYRGRKQLKQEELRLRYQSHTKSLPPAAAAAAAATASWPPSSVSSATVLGAGTPGMTHDPIMPKYWGPWSIHTGLPGPGSDRASYVPPPLSLLGAASSVCGGRASTIAVAPGSDGLIVVDHGTSSSSRRVHHLSMPPMPPPAMPTELDALDSAIDRPTTASSRLEGGTSRRKQLPPLPREAAKRAAAQRRASMHVGMLARAKKG